MHFNVIAKLKKKVFLCITTFSLITLQLAKADSTQTKNFLETFVNHISLAKSDELFAFIDSNKELIKNLKQNDACEILERILTFRDDSIFFAKLIELSPQWVNYENRFGTTPIEIAAKRSNMAALSWLEKKYSANFIFSTLKGNKIPLLLLSEYHEKESFEFLDKYLPFFTTPSGKEELNKYADYLAAILLGEYAYYNDEDDWLDQNKRIKFAGKLLLNYPNIINLLPDSFSEKLYTSFKKEFLGTSTTEALLVTLMKPSKQKELYDFFKKDPHQIAFYAKQSSIAILMALFPAPSRKGLPEYEHYGIYLPLQNFYNDLDVLADEKENSSLLRPIWQNENNINHLDEFILESWETFFIALSKNISHTESTSSLEWNFHEYVIILESYLQTLGVCDRIQEKAKEKKISQIQIEYLTKNILPLYKKFILFLGVKLAQTQESSLGVPLTEASLTDVISHQISTSTGLKKDQLTQLLMELKSSKVFPNTQENNPQNLNQKALLFLQSSMQRLRPQLQQNRTILETSDSN